MIQFNSAEKRIAASESLGVTNESTLEARSSRAFTSAMIDSYQDKNYVISAINSSATTASPEELLSYQLRASDYNIKLSFNSAVTKKFVNAVDTLLRS